MDPVEAESTSRKRRRPTDRAGHAAGHRFRRRRLERPSTPGLGSDHADLVGFMDVVDDDSSPPTEQLQSEPHKHDDSPTISEPPAEKEIEMSAGRQAFALHLIFAVLDRETLIRAGQVCSLWRAASKARDLWVDYCLDLQPRRDLPEVPKVDADALPGLDEDVQKQLKGHAEMQQIEDVYRDHDVMRSFFRVLLAAPCLNSLVIDTETFQVAFLDTFLKAPISEVKTLVLRNVHHHDKAGVRQLSAKILRKFAQTVEELELHDLREDLLPIVCSMQKLKVLRFSARVPLPAPSRATLHGRLPPTCRRLQRLEPLRCPRLDDRGSNDVRGSGDVRGSDVTRRCYQSTVRQLVEAHPHSLRSVCLHQSPSQRMLRALERCRHLESLEVPLPEPPAAASSLALPLGLPGLRRLVLIVNGPIADAAKRYVVLKELPKTVEELGVRLPGRRFHLSEEVRELALCCAAAPGLRRVRVELARRRVAEQHRDALRQQLQADLPGVATDVVLI